MALILMIIVVGTIKGLKNNKEEIKEEIQQEVKQEKVEEIPVEEIKEKVEDNKEPMKIVIAQGESVVVGSEGRLPCGEYIIESCEGEESFNVRIGRYVKEYKNGTKVVLTEKQQITPVSTSIVLR